MDKIYVVATMDVEPATSTTHPSATGPDNWEDGEKFVRGYVARTGEFGLPVTFFIHPEVTVVQGDLFIELGKNGHCVDCLHLHAWKFRDGKYKAHFGGLSENDIRAALSESISMWQSGMGRRPLYFRPGTFSANDFMYQVLVDLGFRGGSCSLPGRIWPRMNAIWTGAEPDPHRAHPIFRQLIGDLEFANMPVSVDFSSRTATIGSNFQKIDPNSPEAAKGNTASNHWDLRPDWQDADYSRIADNIIDQLIDRAPSIPTINFITHNDNDHTNLDDRVCANLIKSMEAIMKSCEARNITPVGTTLDKICDMVLAEPPNVVPFIHA
ncbi:MAG: hypothetical protein CMF69_08430 [Magnetovibrio sp.]|nr:hypothetical protein [Magnetovibrio sp.]